MAWVRRIDTVQRVVFIKLNGSFNLRDTLAGQRSLSVNSFRHTFIDACREAGVDSENRKKITGHEQQDEGGKHGTAHLLKRRKEEIDKVDYDLPSPT